jgi:trehalose 6-phosphate synthase
VTVHYEQNRAQAFAGLRLYDVLMVNSVADGMNLVSKEGPMVNETDGVLILSRTAGSFDELCGGAIPVDPLDIAATADALEAALEMPADERRRRADLLREVIERHQLRDWLRHQTNDLNATRYAREISTNEL